MKRLLLIPLLFLFSLTFSQQQEQIPTPLLEWNSDLRSSSAVTFTTEYQAILARATTLGYTKPSAAQQIKQNQLIVSLKAAGIWSLLDVFYVFATDGSSDFATLNWINPALFQCSKVNSPTFTANQGFNGNGSTSYLNTNWVPSLNGVNYTINNASYGCFTYSGGINAVFGGNDGVRQNFLWSNTGSSSVISRINASNLNTPFPPDTSFQNVTLYSTKRTGSNSLSNYINQNLSNSDAVVSTGLPTVSMFILCRNQFGTPDSFGSVTIKCSMVFTGSGSINISNLYTSWNTYFTSL